MDKKSANGWYNSLEKWEGGLETEGVGPSGGPREENTDGRRQAGERRCHMEPPKSVLRVKQDKSIKLRNALKVTENTSMSIFNRYVENTALLEEMSRQKLGTGYFSSFSMF